MQVKILEYVQGRDIRGSLPNGTVTDVLEPEKVYDVDNALGAWLIENHKAEEVKAEEVKAEPHYGAQAEPELRHDDEVYEAMKPRSTKRSKKSEG
jgi:hypothetical protein